MKYNIYAVYDSAVNAYMRPFTMQADGQALRGFTDEACNAESPVGQHPEDYSLFRIGEYDERNGHIEACVPPKCIGRAHELYAATRARATLEAAREFHNNPGAVKANGQESIASRAEEQE
jgi:hypothetical protein